MCGLCQITKNWINLDLIEIIQFWLMDGSFFWHFDFLLKPPQPVTGLFFVSTYVVCERLSVMHNQVSGWTVNFCPNFPESPFLEFQTRKPPILENFRFEMTKVYSGMPPLSENFRFEMTKVYSRIPPLLENAVDRMWRLICNP